MEKEFDGGGASEENWLDKALESEEAGIEDTQTPTAAQLLTKDKCFTAKIIHEECVRQKNVSPSVPHATRFKILSEVLDLLLAPRAYILWEDVNGEEKVEWLKWIMAGGYTPDEFFSAVKKYDNASYCGLVWTANFIAYRCRTCGISPCMSLCADCFSLGNHAGHDYNFFRSQAGGACDCGNPAVMNEPGFCKHHSRQTKSNRPEVPPDLLVSADAMMPRIFLKFILFCRENSVRELPEVLLAMKREDLFLSLIQDLSTLGAAMRTTMTKTLCNPDIYDELARPHISLKNYEELARSYTLYECAVNSLPFEDIPSGYEDIGTLNGPLVHRTFLDEIVFWTVKFEFPQKLVCLLLNMRPDPDYEDAFAQAFVQHYSRISVMLVRSKDSEKLSNRVVHVSVQLFSDQNLAYRMTDCFHLLHVMVVSLKNMMKSICMPSPLNNEKLGGKHEVVNCTDDVMKHHCYWPVVSDLNNVLSHKSIAVKFIMDDRIVQEWFSFLALFQGMNVNERETLQHIELEPHTYYAAFSAELEASATPMWALVSHLRDMETKHQTMSLLKQCMAALEKWFEAIRLVPSENTEPERVSFHLPLHRYYSIFVCQSIKHQKMNLQDVLPSHELLEQMMFHPLRVQVAFYEILNGLWVRNGLQIKGQAMTYIQCHFCNSFVDADLHLLQICAGELPPDNFIANILDKFKVLHMLSLSKRNNAQNTGESEQKTTMLDSCLTFLATLMSIRSNIGVDEAELTKLEMITLLCMSDRTHSKLMDYMPEKLSSGSHTKDFEAILNEVSTYRAPVFEASGAMQQGMYCPKKEVWEEMYDPIYVLLRAIHRSDFQNSFDRFKQFCKKNGKTESVTGILWPPYRLPKAIHPAYNDPRRAMSCRSFHGVLFTILYKVLFESSSSDHLLSLTIYLLEMLVEYQAEKHVEGEMMAVSTADPKDEDKPDGQFSKWFDTDDIFINSTCPINRVYSPYVTNAKQESEGEMENSDEEFKSLDLESLEQNLTLITGNRPLMTGHELVPYSEEANAIVPSSTELPDTPETPTTSPLHLALPACAQNMQDNMLVQLQHSPNSPTIDVSSPVSPLELPPSSRYPTLLAGNEVGRKGVFVLNRQTQLMRSLLHCRDEYVNIGETLVSLLIKLHSKISGKPGSYSPNFEDNTDSRIGDSLFFIAKVLNKMGRYDRGTRRHILETVNRLYPKKEEEGAGSSEEEAAARAWEKRKRAKEHQRKIMAEFAIRQKQFLESNNWTSATAEGESGSTSADNSMEVEEEEKLDTRKE